MGPGTRGELGAIELGSRDERQWKDASPDSVCSLIKVIDNTCVMVEDGRTVGLRGSDREAWPQREVGLSKRVGLKVELVLKRSRPYREAKPCGRV